MALRLYTIHYTQKAVDVNRDLSIEYTVSLYNQTTKSRPRLTLLDDVHHVCFVVTSLSLYFLPFNTKLYIYDLQKELLPMRYL
jgi:hypothetical protein